MSRTSTAALALLGLASLALMPHAARAQAKPVLTTLHRFDGPHGAYPQTMLTPGTDGNFYGVTPYGGLSDGVAGNGTVFAMTPTGQFTTLFRFNGKNGAYPITSLVEGTDGAFYGATTQGGLGGLGTTFRITADGHFTTLHSFQGSDGFAPSSLTLAPDGSFYGTTRQGGSRGGGTVFHMTASGKMTTLHAFSSRFPDQGFPGFAMVFGPDGALYGTTGLGGSANDGGIFRLATDGMYKGLHQFTSDQGAASGALVLLNGAFYGFTSQDAQSPLAYKITPSGVFTTLHLFADDQYATFPSGTPIVGADGNIYAESFAGGNSDSGVLFSMTPAGAVTTLYKFHTAFDGAYPEGGLVFGADGALYGTTSGGGPQRVGTAFKLTLP